MSDQNIKQLVKQLQNGDISVFDELYYATKNIVYYTILSILRDQSSSEDIMQETYLRALEKIHSYKPSKYTFKAWIVTIARNLALNEYNKRKREFKIDVNSEEFMLGSTEDKSEKQYIIKEILSHLKDEEREIVLMHVVGNLKHREIAKILDIPLGTVTWKYNDSIKKLKQYYEKR